MPGKAEAACVLVSGGLDSAVLVHHMAARHKAVHPVYVKSGLSWESEEVRMLEGFLAKRPANVKPLSVLQMPMSDVYKTHWSVTGKGTPDYDSPDEEMEIPGRNIVLLSKASVYCAINKVSTIAMGSLGGNPFPDATPAFFKSMGSALSRGLGFQIAVVAPFRGMTKVQVIKLGKNLPLEKTMSCVAPKGRAHCGACNKCAERRHAFAEAKVKDKTKYLA